MTENDMMTNHDMPLITEVQRRHNCDEQTAIRKIVAHSRLDYSNVGALQEIEDNGYGTERFFLGSMDEAFKNLDDDEFWDWWDQDEQTLVANGFYNT